MIIVINRKSPEETKENYQNTQSNQQVTFRISEQYIWNTAMSPPQITVSYQTCPLWSTGRHSASDMGNPRVGSDAGQWGACGHDLARQGAQRSSQSALTDPFSEDMGTSRVEHTALGRNATKCEY
jgi:hypothetical protein